MKNNPFSTTFGIKPSNIIYRLKESEQIINDFSSENIANYVYVITGLRGSGKTVLLSTIANHFMKLDDWIVVDPGPKNNILENVASEIYETAKMKKLFLKGEFSFSFSGLTFSLSGKEPVSSVNTLLKKMLEEIKRQKKRVLITIDEIDNSEQMKIFIQAYQSLIRNGYPVLLLMTGLYENVSSLQEDNTLTFLYRAPKIYLQPLAISPIANAYQKLLNLSEEVAIDLAKLTKGYAYAYQVLGYLMYTNKKIELDSSIISAFDQYLAEYVYDKIFSELTQKEAEILMAINGNEIMKVSDIVTKTGFDIKTISVYRDRLIKKGILMSSRYGYVEITLPRFSHYLKFKYL